MSALNTRCDARRPAAWWPHHTSLEFRILVRVQYLPSMSIILNRPRCRVARPFVLADGFQVQAGYPPDSPVAPAQPPVRRRSVLVSVDGSNHVGCPCPATIEEAVQSASDFSSPVASAWLWSTVTQIDSRNGMFSEYKNINEEFDSTFDSTFDSNASFRGGVCDAMVVCFHPPLPQWHASKARVFALCDL